MEGCCSYPIAKLRLLKQAHPAWLVGVLASRVHSQAGWGGRNVRLALVPRGQLWAPAERPEGLGVWVTSDAWLGAREGPWCRRSCSACSSAARTVFPLETLFLLEKQPGQSWRVRGQGSDSLGWSLALPLRNYATLVIFVT